MLYAYFFAGSRDRLRNAHFMMKAIEKKALQTFQDHWEFWNNRTEETLTESLIHWPGSFQGFGTAIDEVWRCTRDMEELSKRAFEENSEGFKVEVIWLEPKHLVNEYVLIWGEIKIIVEMPGEDVVVEPVRITGLYKDVGSHMEYVQWHSSVPDASSENEIWGGTGKPKRYEEVSVLFTDFVGFTNIVATIPAVKLVNELRDIFHHFDQIMESQGIERIQTIGDAYLAVCGIPNEDPDHAKKCVRAAQEIITYLEERNCNSALKWDTRIGIHSGPVTAGVMASKRSNKFSYDVFGDTVNVAARIESASEKGRINISAYTFDLVKDEFPCTYRGKINTKGKGELDMYFVN